MTMAASASNSTPNTSTQPVNKTAHAFDKATLDATLSRRFFFAPAFEIYGGESTYSSLNNVILLEADMMFG